MATIVTGDEYYAIDGQIAEIKRQLRQKNGYPYSIPALRAGLQKIIDGQFGGDDDRWHIRDGVIYITLPASEGVTGPQWIERLKGFNLSSEAIGLLKSNDFKPTTGVVHKLAILTAKFWKHEKRITRMVRSEGQNRGWHELNPEAICILRESFTDADLEQMGFWWIAGVHELIGVDGGPHFLCADRHSVSRWLSTRWARPGSGWGDDGAFAWSLSQENQS
jgi:hypothetical protein